MSLHELWADATSAARCPVVSRPSASQEAHRAASWSASAARTTDAAASGAKSSTRRPGPRGSIAAREGSVLK